MLMLLIPGPYVLEECSKMQTLTLMRSGGGPRSQHFNKDQGIIVSCWTEGHILSNKGQIIICPLMNQLEQAS